MVFYYKVIQCCKSTLKHKKYKQPCVRKEQRLVTHPLATLIVVLDAIDAGKL